MVRIFVNNESLDFKAETEKNIGQLLGEVEKFCNENGHTIYKIFLGEDELPLESLDALFQKSIQSNIELNLFTLSAETIKKNIDYIATDLEKKSESLKEVGIKLQTNDDVFVLDLIAGISKSIKTLFEYLNVVEFLHIEKTKIEKEKILQNQKFINEFLKEITNALEEKDIVTVSDLSEYELAPLLESFVKELRAL